MLKPHIVILGAGFGGTYVAKRLSPLVKRGEIDVTIVNKTNYFLFTPLLHEVATGSLSAQSVAEPLREIFHGTGIHICQGSIETIDASERRVHIIGSGSRRTIPYDYLVIATGAETNYYGIPGAEKFAVPLKTLSDAARIRDRVITSFEEAIFCEDPAERSHKLSFAIVGGGPTGVEVAAELVEFVQGMVKRYYSDTDCDLDELGHCTAEEPKISLIHTGAELLPQFRPRLRQAAADRLQKAGVALHFGNMVTAVTPQGLTLSNNTTVMAGTVIWAAGVKSIIPEFKDGTPPVSAGRLSVDEYFHVGGDERIFALGDAAGYMDTHEQDSAKKPPAVPMLAQVAVQEAKRVAQNILASIGQKPLKGFHYHSKGTMVSVGQWFAIGEIFSLNIAGKLTWWMWRTVYLFKFASWKKRIRIGFDWAFDALYPRDITNMLS